MQNLVTIPQGVSVLRMRQFAYQKCLVGFFFAEFFQHPTAEAPEQIFTQNMSNDAVPRKDMPFRVRIQTFNIYSPLFEKNRYFGSDFDGTKCSTENRSMGRLQVYSP